MADENGEIQGNFSASETVVFLGYSKKLSPRFTGGLTFKPVFSTIETYNSWGIAFDAGVTYHHANGRFHAGALLRNGGRQISRYGETSAASLPPDLQIGFSTQLAHAPFRFSVTARDLLSGSLDYEIPENDYGISVPQRECQCRFWRSIVATSYFWRRVSPLKEFLCGRRPESPSTSGTQSRF
ncbi:hypothetical protein [Marinilabilia salmonicolor]|uniref:hypothetical protein n=1 Tax=Marinilabilia salmonicolor TaxID=989 RepID=UPI001F43BE05|nr:hypothetical protein [Marinilabilia salmonicolor]